MSRSARAAAASHGSATTAIRSLLDESKFTRREIGALEPVGGLGEGAASFTWASAMHEDESAWTVLLFELWPAEGPSRWLAALPEWFADGAEAAAARAAKGTHGADMGEVGRFAGSHGEATLAGLAAGDAESLDPCYGASLSVVASSERGAGAPAVVRQDSLARSLVRSRAAPAADGGGEDEGGLEEGGAAPEREDGLLHLTVCDHSHTRYCDRTLRVCTAEDRVREGNAVRVDATGIVGTLQAGIEAAARGEPGVDLRWFASVTDAEAVRAAEPGGGPEDDVPFLGPETRVVGGAAFLRVSRPALPGGPVPVLGEGEEIPEEWAAVLRRAGIPDGMPHLPLRAVLAAHAALVGQVGSADDVRPTFSSAGACAAWLGLLLRSWSDPSTLALEPALVGRRIVCVARQSGDAPASWVSPEWGPVEAAPPRCREVWISGEAAPGQRLQAQTWYWGGRPGPCTFHWVKVSEDGDRTTLEPRVAGEAEGEAAREDGQPADGSLVAVLPGDVGCKFKVTAGPTRSDGMGAERTSARPSKRVA